MKKNKGFAGMSFHEIAMKQTMKAVEAPLYCRLCGLNIKEPSTSSPAGTNGAWRRYLDWEIENGVHQSCAANFNNNIRR